MKIVGLDTMGLTVAALVVAAVVFAIRDGPFEASSLLLVGIAATGILLAAIDGPWKNDEARTAGWVGVLLVGGLTVFVFLVLRDDAPSPCIQYERTDEGGECLRRAEDR